jgi:NodT family efflux transporter outer membrane factor (OMF) lipoprotein
MSEVPDQWSFRTRIVSFRGFPRVKLQSSCRLAAALALSAALPVAGCTVGPDFERPTPWWSPTSWFGGARQPSEGVAASVPVAAPIDPQWWRLFNDPELTTLEGRLAAANLDVRIATVRMAEARSSVGIAQAALFPTLNGNASYTREQASQKGALGLIGGSGGNPGPASNGLGDTSNSVPNTALFEPFNLYQYGFDASWELDFWGHARRGVESANAQFAASEESRRDVLVSASAELARDYVQLRGTQRNIEITQRNLETARESLRLTQERAAGGVTTDLDVANAAAQVATIASELPTLAAQERALTNAIALLLGEAPNTLYAELTRPGVIPPAPPRVPVGLPSELARRRPDIRRAEAQLHAATADVGVAVADFYPQITLSGSVALQAVNARDLANWAAHTYSLGPSMTLPIFQGGQLRRTLELRKEQQQEAAITYQHTVLGALHEVDNALTSYEAEQRRRTQLEQSVAQNRRALDLARQRYSQGVTDFLSVLDAQRSLLAAEQQLTDATTNISTDLVQLYKALGGGWETTFPEETPGAAAHKQAAVQTMRNET